MRLADESSRLESNDGIASSAARDGYRDRNLSVLASQQRCAGEVVDKGLITVLDTSEKSVSRRVFPAVRPRSVAECGWGGTLDRTQPPAAKFPSFRARAVPQVDKESPASI